MKWLPYNNLNRLCKLRLASIGVFLLLLGAVLAAQPSRESLLPRANLGSTAISNCSPSKELTLLPVPSLSTPAEEEVIPLIRGVSDSLRRSHLKIDPDGFKVLLGYVGPYYNTSKLDGRVDVVGKSVHVWPSERWQATGIIRNQTCQNIHVIAITARLLGQAGELLDTVTATTPVDELRPGEPAPFAIEARISRSDVIGLEWNIDYTLSKNTPPRNFTFSIYEAAQVLDGSRYSLVGSIRNEATSTASTRVVAAWLDDQGRVIYVSSPTIRLIADPTHMREAVDLTAGDFEDFYYTTDDPSLIALLSTARIALWGVSN